MWYKSDPREYFNKRGTILICTSYGRIFVGNVETKYAYHIDLGELYNGSYYIYEQDNWPKDWIWCLHPTVHKVELLPDPPKWWE